MGFKYCALYYLNQWVSKDRVYCEVLSSDNELKKLEVLKDAAWFYRIARNLPDRYDVGKGLPRLKPILDIIELQTPGMFKGTELLPSIIRVSELISSKYSHRKFLSLTTKFLWLKFKSPIIIYDNRARRAINTNPNDLESYYLRWRESFESNASAIDIACNSLPKVHEYSMNPEITTPEYIEKIASQQWFKERVFDMYLWHLGGKE